MWIGVTSRFRQFLGALRLTPEELDRGNSRVDGVVQSLNRSYFHQSDKGLGATVVGSWGKETAISPSGDVDVYYVVPLEELHRYDRYRHNGQSALLADVRDRLSKTYPNSFIKGDGQVVVVRFNDAPQVEIAPTIRYPDNTFLLPNSNAGGTWINADPASELEALNRADTSYSGNARPLLKILKRWKQWHDVAVKSFHLELLVPEFLAGCSWRNYGLFYYDWLVRDFFEFLISRANTSVFAPGTHEEMNVGNAWVPKATAAYRFAENACIYEKHDLVSDAGVEWQKIFGPKIPERPA